MVFLTLVFILVGFALFALVIGGSLIFFQKIFDNAEDKRFLRQKARDEMERQIDDSRKFFVNDENTNDKN